MISGEHDEMQLSSRLISLQPPNDLLENRRPLSTCKLQRTFDSVLRHRYLLSRQDDELDLRLVPAQVIPETGSLARKVGDAPGGNQAFWERYVKRRLTGECQRVNVRADDELDHRLPHPYRADRNVPSRRSGVDAAQAAQLRADRRILSLAQSLPQAHGRGRHRSRRPHQLRG